MDSILRPFWAGREMTGETLLPIAEADGSVRAMPLLYPAAKIISVTNTAGDIRFCEGSDYRLADGCLAIPAGSRIPVMKYRDYYLPQKEDPCFPRTGGGYIRYSEGAYFHRRQLSVSYCHEGFWPGPVPADKATFLPRTLQRLCMKKPVSILIFGDSISTGANASKVIGAAPFQAPWYELLVKGLLDKYRDTLISLENISVGGTVSEWGASIAAAQAAPLKPDLCVIAFGMNDGSTHVPVGDYLAHITDMMDAIRAAQPDCEFILIATTLANAAVAGFLGCQKDYLPALLKLETTGACVADMTTFHEALLSRKRFADMTGNNVNHPNDFLSRAYAQVLLKTMGALPEA